MKITDMIVKLVQAFKPDKQPIPALIALLMICSTVAIVFIVARIGIASLISLWV